MKTPISIRRQRILVALDVLDQIATRAILPVTGNVFGMEISQAISSAHPLDQAQKSLAKIVKRGSHCEVCAKGSLIIAHTLRFNAITNHALIGMRSCRAGHSLPEFSPVMLAELESLFEGSYFDWNQAYISPSEFETLRQYAAKEHLFDMMPAERLHKLMTLLILNEGRKFVLPRE